jgi:hypothetical protein
MSGLSPFYIVETKMVKGTDQEKIKSMRYKWEMELPIEG